MYLFCIICKQIVATIKVPTLVYFCVTVQKFCWLEDKYRDDCALCRSFISNATFFTQRDNKMWKEYFIMQTVASWNLLDCDRDLKLHGKCMSPFYHCQTLFSVATSLYYSVVATGTGWDKVYNLHRPTEAGLKLHIYTKFMQSTVVLN